MSKLSDYADLGFLPLQDFQADGRISISRRKMVVGARVVKEHDPTLEATPSGHHTELGRENGMGTLGDMHPWLYWQTAGRERRGMGAWQSVFAAVTDGESAVGSGPTTVGSSGPSVIYPVRRDGWRADRRFAAKPAIYGPGLQLIPRGAMSVVLPATEERAQYELVGNLDPRLWAPNAGGPGDCGTIVADLQPDWEPCMGGSSRPGIGGRQAKLQSLVRVIAMSPGGGTTDNLFPSSHNLLALNYTASDQDGVPGYGAVFGRCVMGGGGGGPITQGGAPALAATAAGSSGDVGKTPSEWGTFRPLSQPQYAVALLDAFDAGGPIHCGHIGDKHRIGTDRDGHPINSAHLSVNANWFRNQDNDGPMLFEGRYPNPGPLPLTGRVHLSWDGDYQHMWRGKARPGIWRWWCEVPYVVPTPTTGQPPTPGQPPGTPAPRPRGPTTPGGPATPGAPGPGVPVPPTGGPGGPGTGGPAGPGVPPGGGPPAPPGPITPNPGGTRFPGYPATPPAPKPGGGPITPGGGDGGEDAGAQPNDQPGPLPPTRDSVPTLPNGGNARPGRTVGGNDDANDRKRKKPNILHPFSTGFSGTQQRPQKWQRGAQDFLGSDLSTVSAADVIADEQARPNVLSGTAWGSQTDDCWNYAESPALSVSRGGTASGGLLYHPPGVSMEGYFGLGPASWSAWAAGTTSYVACAPGVALALGQPHRDGGLQGYGVRMRQASAASQQLLIEQLDSARNPQSIAKMGIDSVTGQVLSQFFGSAVQIPDGTSAERPAIPEPGQVRVLNDSGAITTVEYYEVVGAKWQQLAVSDTPYSLSGLGVLGRGDLATSSPWTEISTVTGSNGVLLETGGSLQWSKVSPSNCTFGLQSSEGGDPVRTICKSSVTEQTLTTQTVAADLLATAGSHAILEFWGSMLNNSGSTSAMTLRIKLAGTTVYQQAASVTTSANRRALYGRIVVASRGASKQRMTGLITMSQATAAAVGVGDWSDSATMRGGPIYGDGTATTSSPIAVLVSFQSDVNSGSIDVTLVGATLSYVPAS